MEKYTKQPGLMSTNVSQHQAFDAGLEAFNDYVKSVKPEEYDAERFRELLDGFGGVLEAHLREEIGTLLSLERFGWRELKGAWDELERAVIDDMGNKVRFVGFFFYYASRLTFRFYLERAFLGPCIGSFLLTI